MASSVDALKRKVFAKIDRTPSRCYPPRSDSGQDTHCIGWSPLARAECSWELLQSLVDSDGGCASAVGAMIGMAVGDSLGAPLEFLEVNPHEDYVDTRSVIACQRPCVLPKTSAGPVYQFPKNAFALHPGQWTDDTAMGLCLADSLLTQGDYHGGDARVRWHMWWVHGYCNAFRHDRRREPAYSIGLGGNISRSLKEIESHITPDTAVHADAVPHIFASDRDDAGNGSIMRLAAVPIAFHAQESRAVEVASLQSFATHPGYDASLCCQFMALFIVRAIRLHAESEPHANIRSFLGRLIRDFTSQFLETRDSHTYPEHVIESLKRMDALLTCVPPSRDKQHWDWKRKELGIDDAMRAGCKADATYFGSYCMDGLAMALWALWNSEDFAATVIRAVNLLGDADSVGAIAGQMAGAFYGWHGICSTAFGRQCVDNLRVWDPSGEIGLRAACLFFFDALSTSKTTVDIDSVARTEIRVRLQQKENFPRVRVYDKPDGSVKGEIPNGTCGMVVENPDGNWVLVKGDSWFGWIGRKNIQKCSGR